MPSAKKFTCHTGTSRQVIIWYPLPLHTVYVHVLIHAGEGGGWGRIQPERRLEGQQFTKLGRSSTREKVRRAISSQSWVGVQPERRLEGQQFTKLSLSSTREKVRGANSSQSWVGVQPEKRLEGQQFTKLGRKYQHDWMSLQSINSDKHLPKSLNW